MPIKIDNPNSVEVTLDQVGAALSDGTTIDFTFTDSTNTITAEVIEAAVDHNSLNNLATGDVHTQYALLTGRSGGQTLIGSDTTAENLTLTANSVSGGSIRMTSDVVALSSLNVDYSTASRALVTDGSKNVVASAVTSTELGYVSGVTSAIQTQIDAIPAHGAATSLGVLYYNLAFDSIETEAGFTYNPTSNALFVPNASLSGTLSVTSQIDNGALNWIIDSSGSAFRLRANAGGNTAQITMPSGTSEEIRFGRWTGSSDVSLLPDNGVNVNLGSATAGDRFNDLHLDGAGTFYSSINADYATATTVPYLDASKNLISSAVTPTELGYLTGVTSAIQTQLDAKVDEVSSTDNAVTRFDGTTGSVQDSGVLIDDSNNVTIPGNAEIDGDLNHDGSNIGFFGTTPTTQAAAYTPTNVSTDRSYDANATSTDELADVLGTLIADLQAYGLLQ